MFALTFHSSQLATTSFRLAKKLQLTFLVICVANESTASTTSTTSTAAAAAANTTTTAVPLLT